MALTPTGVSESPDAVRPVLIVELRSRLREHPADRRTDTPPSRHRRAIDPESRLAQALARLERLFKEGVAPAGATSLPT
jgi:hypothetical protein